MLPICLMKSHSKIQNDKRSCHSIKSFPKLNVGPLSSMSCMFIYTSTTILCNGNWSKCTPAEVLDKQLFCTRVVARWECLPKGVAFQTSFAQFCYYEHVRHITIYYQTKSLCLLDFRNNNAALHNMFCLPLGVYVSKTCLANC